MEELAFDMHLKHMTQVETNTIKIKAHSLRLHKLIEQKIKGVKNEFRENQLKDDDKIKLYVDDQMK